MINDDGVRMGPEFYRPEFIRGRADFIAGVPQYGHSPYNHCTHPVEYVYWYLGWCTERMEQNESR